MTPAARRKSVAARAAREREVARAALRAACHAARLRAADVTRCPKVPRHVVVRLSAAVALLECGGNPNALPTLRVETTRPPDPALVDAARKAALAALAKQAAELADLAAVLREQHEADIAKSRRLPLRDESTLRRLHRHRSSALRDVEARGYKRDDLARVLGYSRESIRKWSRLAASSAKRSC